MEAIYFGTFAPMHKGHISDVIFAKRKYDHVHLIVSGYQNDRGDLAGMSLNDRYRLIREIFKTETLITVHKLNEDDIPKYPNGWDKWLKKIDDMITDVKNKKFICGEKEYSEELQKRGYDVDLVSRSVIPISGTEIRNNPYTNWNYIHTKFRKFFTKKVLIYGTASTGKSTLTKDLANYFNTTYTLEYARHYEEKYNVLDEELDIRDLTNIGIGQFNINKKQISSQATNKIFFADTDVMTTSVYLTKYNSKDTQYESVNNIFSGLIDKQEWDLILFLQPDTEYVNDGFRDMNHASNEIRKEMNYLFREKLISENLEYTELKGTFLEKFKQAVQLCDNLVNKT